MDDTYTTHLNGDGCSTIDYDTLQFILAIPMSICILLTCYLALSLSIRMLCVCVRVCAGLRVLYSSSSTADQRNRGEQTRKKFQEKGKYKDECQALNSSKQLDECIEHLSMAYMYAMRNIRRKSTTKKRLLFFIYFSKSKKYEIYMDITLCMQCQL